MTLARPGHVECPCGYAGAPHPAVEAALRDAASQLDALRRRRLDARSAAQDARARGASTKTTLIVVSLGLTMIAIAPAFLGPYLFLRGPGGSITPWAVCTCGGPLAFLLPTVLLTLIWVHRRQSAVRPRSAVPPDEPGRQPRCNVCGADLALGEHQAIAVCGYCDTENVVTPEVLRPRALSVGHLEQYASHVQAEAHRTERSGGQLAAIVLLVLALAMVGGPVVGCIVGALLESLLA